MATALFVEQGLTIRNGDQRDPRKPPAPRSSPALTADVRLRGSSRPSGEKTQRRRSRPSYLHEVAGRQPTKALVRACMAALPLQCAVRRWTTSARSPPSNAEGRLRFRHRSDQ